MARRGAPSLYELLRKSPAQGGATMPPSTTPGGASRAAPPSAPARPVAQHGANHAAPQPIVFQVPLVWVVAAAVCLVVAVSVAFVIGTKRGGADVLRSDDAPAPTALQNDAPALGAANMGNTAARGAAPNTPAPGGRTVGPSAAPDNPADPRVKGFRYFVLAHPSTDRAPAMVEFCRGNGLDAYLVPDDNAMLRKIVVLPGYRDSSEKSSAPIRELEGSIRRVGEKWKNAARGNKDFSDAYPELYR